MLFSYIGLAASLTPSKSVKAGSNLINTAWQFKRTITIDNQSDNASGEAIAVTFTGDALDDATAKANGADVRFTTASGRLTGDGPAYWIEQRNDNGVTRIWVKVLTLSARGKTTLQMHYGNSVAQAVSNCDKTLLYFEDGDYTRRWTNMFIDEVVEQDGLLKLRGTDGQNGIITTRFDVTGLLIVRTRYQRGGRDEHWVRVGVGGWGKWLCCGDHTNNAATGTNYVMLFDSASLNNLKSAPFVIAANTVFTKNWRRVAYWYDGCGLKGQRDNMAVALPMLNASSKLTLRTLDNDNWDSFAFITVSAYTGPDPTVTLGQRQTN